MPVNVLALRVFGPILILTGIAGFVLPAELALMSGAPAYNWFHIGFGVLGTVLALGAGDRACRGFNVGFGVIDLYQAIASPCGWWPAAWFQWTTADDVAHWILGLALVGIGLLARPRDGDVAAGSPVA